jgi:uncharacterized protein (TIGR03435 family)
MKKMVILMAALVLLAGPTLLAQDLTGTWQGVLRAGGRDLRTVFKISAAEAGGLRAVMYSIDQGGQPIAVTPVTLQGSIVKMLAPGIGGTFEGRLEGDGSSMTGTWSQGGPNPLPLTLKRVAVDAAWAIPAIPAPPKAMAADASPSFDVASIKPSQPDRPGKAFTVRGRQFATINTTLTDLISFAYGIHAKQIAGAPAWVDTEKYDLTAQPEGDGQPNERQWKVMIQQLLADRFKLAFHRDMKELSVYAITVGKDGSKIAKSEGNPNGLPGLFFRGLGNLPVTNATMADFAGVMQGAVLDRPVVDRTGLTGRWDFTLRWTPDEFQFGGLGVRVPPPANTADAPPDLFTAIQEQLGLKLESTRAPAEVLVVDRVEKPSAD